VKSCTRGCKRHCCFAGSRQPAASTHRLIATTNKERVGRRPTLLPWSVLAPWPGPQRAQMRTLRHGHRRHRWVTHFQHRPRHRSPRMRRHWRGKRDSDPTVGALPTCSAARIATNDFCKWQAEPPRLLGRTVGRTRCRCGSVAARPWSAGSGEPHAAGRACHQVRTVTRSC